MNLLNKINNFEKVAEQADFLSPIVEQAEKLKEKVVKGQLNVVFTGEFSSGKTSLINALFNLNLPTDVLPETTAIWKIITTKGEEKIKVYLSDGEVLEFEDIEKVKEISPKDIKYIEYYIHSDLDEGIVIVDTPGLSSLESFHQEILENFINEADVLIVAVDANQGLTKSTQDFLRKKLKEQVKTYIAITKSDSKPPKSIEEIKKYIKDNFGEYFAKVIAVSAKKGDIKELKEILDEIARRKEEILIERVNRRLKSLCDEASSIISFQIENASLDLKDINEREKEIKEKLREIENEIKKQIEKVKKDIDNIVKKSTKTFETNMKKNIKWIIEGLYDENLKETIEHRFDKVIEESAEIAFKQIQDELQKSLENVDSTIVELQEKFNVGKTISIRIAEALVNFREYITNLLPFLLNIFPRLGPIIGKIGAEVAKHILDAFIQGGTKIFVENKVRKGIEEVAKGFEKETKNKLNEILDELLEEILEDLYAQRDSYVKAVEELKQKKEERKEEFSKYIENLKELKNMFRECGGIA